MQRTKATASLSTTFLSAATLSGFVLHEDTTTIPNSLSLTIYCPKNDRSLKESKSLHSSCLSLICS